MKIPINIYSEKDIIHIWYRDKNKIKSYEKIKFKPYFYISDINKPIIDINEAEKTYYNKNNKHTYEKDLYLDNRYLIDKYYNKELEKTPLRVCILDIEVFVKDKKFPCPIEAKTPIISISVYDNFTNKYKTFIDKNEEKLLKEFVKYYKKCNFDILTGWNIDNFDIPYIINRLKIYKQEKILSPINKIIFNNYKKTYKIAGVSVLDYLLLYKKYTINKRESYSLNYISKTELGEEKYKYKGSINDLTKEELIKYNIRDVELVKMLDDKFNFIDLIDEIRRMSKIPFENALNNSSVCDNLVLCELKKMNKIACSKKYNVVNKKYVGAFVAEPKLGVWKWIVDCDYTSLYPFIMINLNISPETKTINSNNVIVAGNGVKFNKEKGIFPILLERVFKERKMYKKMYLENKGKEDEKRYYLKQYAMKILLNSFYGWVGFSKSRFYDKDNAEAITITGQQLIKYAINIVEKNNFINIASDTDSILFSSNEWNNKEDAKEAAKKIADEINNSLKIYCKEKYNIDNSTFNIKQEIVAESGLFLGKKRYALKVIEEEGVETIEYVIKGIEIVRSDTPKIARDFLLNVIKMILNFKPKEEINLYINDFKEKILEMQPEKIASPCSIVKHEYEYKNLPIHINGMKLWNSYYEPKITKGMKCKWLYIKKCPKNITNNYIITFPEDEKLPEGFEVDRNIIIDKLINNKINDIYEIIGWNKQQKLF
jgi:DNA polymerase elongation subunit (family B)